MYAFLIIFSEFLTGFTSALPDDYCLFKLNTSDCNRKPSPVFTYYLPGSRCEIEYWRGCPTYNMFENEYQCSHFCIGRMFVHDSSEENQVMLDFEDDRCQESLNPQNCTKGLNVTVYTYNPDEKSCVEAVWTGCDTRNKFKDEKSCSEECVNDESFQLKLKTIQPAEAETIIDILDEVNKQDEPTIEPATTEELPTPTITTPVVLHTDAPESYHTDEPEAPHTDATGAPHTDEPEDTHTEPPEETHTEPPEEPPTTDAPVEAASEITTEEEPGSAEEVQIT